MKKNDLTTFLLILFVLTLFNIFILSSMKNKKGGKPAEIKEAGPLSQTEPAKAPAQEQLATLETPLFKVTFTNLGARIKSFQLKKYLEPDHQTPVELVANPKEPVLNFWAKGREYLSQAPFQIKVDAQNLTVLARYQDGQSQIIKKFSFDPASYLFNLEISGHLASETGYLTWGPGLNKNAGPLENEAYIFADSRFNRIKGKNFSLSQADWTGVGSKYFLAAILPKSKASAAIEKNPDNRLTAGCQILLKDRQLANQFKIWAGPKDYQLLKNLGLGLEKTVELGWSFIEPFSLLILYSLKFLYKFLGNYGVIIILLTILIKIVFHPLSLKSFESTSKIQKIQPEIKKLQEKYKNQPEKMQKETAELYKLYKVNPFGGCLPILIQIPIFFALFSTLSNSIELRGSGFFLWITDLSRPDTLGYLAGIPINILPILMGLTMFFQQKMMPMADTGGSQQMLLLMPILLTFLFWGFPSGLVLYWLVNNLLSIGEQYLFLTKSRQMTTSPKPKN